MNHLDGLTGEQLAMELVRHYEGCKLHPYRFPGESWWTVGWGHALGAGEKIQPITQVEADSLLERDLEKTRAELQKQLGYNLAELTPGQLGATLSFKYNCKPVLFAKSTFLQLLRKRACAEAANELKRWVHGERGVVLRGLVARRTAEDFIFRGGSLLDLVQKHNWYQ